MIGTGASRLTTRHPPHTLALPGPGQHGVERRAHGFANRGREGCQVLRECAERVAQAGAEASSRQQRPQTLGRAVAASREEPPDLIGGLRRGRSPVPQARGWGQGDRPGRRRVAQMPEYTATDDRGQGPPGGATPAGLCSGAKLHRPGPLTSGAHCDQPLWAQGADQAREGPGREGAEHRAPRQTKAAVGGPQGLAGHLRSHLAVAQAPRRSPRAPGAARGTRQTPAREDRPDGPGRQGSGASDAPDRGKSPDV